MGARIVISGVLLLAVSACATHAPEQSREPAMPMANATAVTRQLYSQYAEWGGTRYRLGGTDKNGIDCSGFTHVTFMDRFGIQIPRTTQQQIKLGIHVSPGELQAGDLVFFKTGFKNRHVGIYAGDRQFLHASASRGVILSSLDNPYWRGKFWKARRVPI